MLGGKGEGGSRQSGAADDLQAVADSQQPGEALPHAVVSVDDQDAESAIEPGAGSVMARWCRRAAIGGSDLRGGGPGRNDRSALRHPSRIDVTSRWHGGPAAASPAGAGGTAGRQRLRPDVTSTEVPAPGWLWQAKLGADAVGPYAHAGQAQVAVGHGRRIEALAVVLDAEPDAAIERTDLDPDLPWRRRA